MKNVLVIDNHPGMLKFMSNLLEKKGHHVLTAEDGISALSRLDIQIPDIIFVDMVMPNISGEKLCRIIRRRPRMKGVWLVVLSGIAAENDVDFQQLGVDACIAKGPFDQMAAHTLNVMAALEQGRLGAVSGKVFGLEDMNHREVITELLSSKMHSEVILGNLSEGILELTPNGQIVYANQMAVQIMGMHEEELLSLDFLSFFKENHYHRMEKLFVDILKDNNPRNIPEDSPIELNQKKIALTVLPIHHGGADCIIVILNDVSEKKLLEDKLRHSQKMEAIATLAGGIAHEFNNALYAITGNLELLQMDLKDNEEVSKYSQSMNHPINRMTRLTKQLLAYAQIGSYHFEKIRLCDFTKESFQLLKHGIDPFIQVEMVLSNNGANVEMDLTQMQMVLSSILTNAVEALGGKGKIKIFVEDKKINEDFIKIDPDIKQGQYACLTIEDSGQGMDSETIKKVFDPFYSTKFHGRGLSMAAAYGIVKHHHGTIRIESQLGKGTKVHIYLPVCQKTAPESCEPLPETIKGSGTVLLIEDEESVMEITHTLLERAGYRILSAKTGREAVDIAKGFEGEIDSVILDIGLPDMGGDKVYAHLKDARPDIKVMICSGYSSEGVAKDIMRAGAQGFIQKPFSLISLSAKLKEMMEGKSTI
ncbi:MAG: response regulator [Deltaproteobacteria bacterium]|nr:response regulator [Deltaproteobacteria bacterium]